MKSRSLATLIAILLGIALGPATHTQGTNNWTTGNGKWEIGANWSLGVPTAANGTVIGNNSVIGPGIVTIDPTTVSSNSVNPCLTVSDLTLKGAVGRGRQLFIFNNSFSTPLTVDNSLIVQSGGSIVITNGALNATGPVNSNLVVDGFVTVTEGSQLTTARAFIGSTGIGNITVFDSTWSAESIHVGLKAGARGTLTLAGDSFSTISVSGELNIGENANATGTVSITGGQLLFPINTSTTVGLQGVGQMTVSNATVQFYGVGVAESDGAVGTLTVASGILTGSFLTVGGSEYSTGTVWLTGGQLIVNDANIGGLGQMTVSNGTWQDGTVVVDRFPSMHGVLNLVGGTNIFGSLQIGGPAGFGTGMVWLAGAQLTTTNSPALVGATSSGQMTMTAGNWLAGEVDVGAQSDSPGTLTMLGGQLVATNTPGQIVVGGYSVGHMSVAGGSVITRSLSVSASNGAASELVINAGSVTVFDDLIVGDCAMNDFGVVEITGGTLYVTNGTHDAILEVRNGLFLLDGGALVVDKLVVTNGCSSLFDHFGGTLSAATVLLDPNQDTDGDDLPNDWEQAHGLDPFSSTGNNGPDGDPDGDGFTNLQEYLAGSDPQNLLSTPLQLTAPPFQITAIVRSGNDVVLAWTTPGGTTNQVQVTGGNGNGSYATNGFANLGSQILVGGTGGVTTNYLDIGGATNKPSRFYRVRLVP